MNRFSIATFVVAVSVGAAVVQAQDAPVPEFPKPVEEHEWLRQLAGEWESEAEIHMEPGQPPVTSKGTETVRALGGFWIVSENNGTMMGEPFTGIMTLGYDTGKKKYVGTWTDSMHGYLWTYEGTRDAAGRVLTLETEGPSPAKPGALSRFRETIELKTPDHKVFSSSMQGEDGRWTKMMTINYRRKK